MCMHEALFGDYPIPEETVRIAQRAFPKGNLYMQIRDQFGMLYQNHQFAHLFASEGQPALEPARLALVTVMQYVEGVGDRQAADNVRDRISWKYALGLALDDPGFDFSVLCEFRARVLMGDVEQLLFDTVLQLFREAGLLKARGKQRSDSTHILAVGSSSTVCPRRRHSDRRWPQPLAKMAIAYWRLVWLQTLPRWCEASQPSRSSGASGFSSITAVMTQPPCSSDSAPRLNSRPRGRSSAHPMMWRRATKPSATPTGL